VITYGSFVPSNVMVMADGWLMVDGRGAIIVGQEEVPSA
jgi:hypothetical protein